MRGVILLVGLVVAHDDTKLDDMFGNVVKCWVSGEGRERSVGE